MKNPLIAVPDEAFGHFSRTWKKFVSELQPLDKIYSFETIWKNEWNPSKRVTNYVAVRDHQIAHHFITKSKRLVDASH